MKTISPRTAVALLLGVLLSFGTLLQAQEAQPELPKELVKGMQKKDPMAFVRAGDLALARKEVGTACQYYEQAIYFDPDCAEAYLKFAAVYKSSAPNQSITKLQELKLRQPDNLTVDKALADVYYTANRFADAVKEYERFIHTPQATDAEQLHYAFALFMNHAFEQSLAIVRQGLARNPRHAALNRLAMYNYTDMKQYDAARDAADAFFNRSDSAQYSALDTLYRNALWQGMSEMYESKNDYPRAIAAYLTYYHLLRPQEQTRDRLIRLGRLYYGEGTAGDTLTVSADMRRAALTSADSVFSLVAARDTTDYTGNFWRARTNSALDPETTQGLAKPYYDAVATQLLSEGDTALDDNPRRKSALIECYSYLGYYYLLTKKYADSKSYWQKILALDPGNAVAKRALAGIK
jgi:tetratricopeptide (TPR) repeat protein